MSTKIYYPKDSGMTKSELHELIEEEIQFNDGWVEEFGEYDLSYLGDNICQYIVDELQRIQERCIDEPEEEFVCQRRAFFKRLLTGLLT